MLNKLTTLQQIENKFLEGEKTIDLYVEYGDCIDTIYDVNIRELLQAIAVGEELKVDDTYTIYSLGKNFDREGNMIGLGKDNLMEGSGCYNVYAQYSEAEEFVLDEILEMNDYEISIDEARKILNKEGG